MHVRRTLILPGILAAVVTLGACSIFQQIQPTGTPSTPKSTPLAEPLPTATIEQTASPDPTVVLTQYLDGPPLPFFTPRQPFTLSYVGKDGWGIGSIEGESDHVFKQVSLDLWTDVTPPEPAPAPGSARKQATGFFLGKELAWVAYTTGPGTGQTHVVIWRMVDRFPHVSWVPSVIETRGGIAGVELYFLDESHGWSLVTFEEAGMNKQYIALYSTSDGGATWNFLFDPMEGSEIQSCGKTGIKFETPEVGWVTRACRGLYSYVFIDRTVNGGLTWEQVILPPPDDALDLFSGEGYCDLFSPNYFPPTEWVFVVDCKIQFNPEEHMLYLYATKDNGSSWTMQPIPHGDLLFVNRFVAYSISQEIFKTENGGLDWARVRAVNWDGQFIFTNEERAAAVVRSRDEIAYVESYDGLLTFFEGNPSVHPSQDPR